MPNFLGSMTDRIIAVAPKVLATLVILVIVSFVVKFFSRTIGGFVSRKTKGAVIPEENMKRIATISGLVIKSLTIVLWGIGVTIILGELGINIGPILTAAGIFGLAVSFGMQSLIKDIVSGIFILLEDQVRIGDVVSINGTDGTVEEINLRSVVIRDAVGAVHTIGNGSTGVITNMSRGWSAYLVEVTTSIANDPDAVIRVFKQVDDDIRTGDTFEGAILRPLEILGLDRLTDGAMLFSARLRTKPGMQATIGREYNRRIKRALDDAGIKF